MSTPSAPEVAALDPGVPAAFFDLDRTLIPGSATSAFAFAAFRAGFVPIRSLVKDLLFTASFLTRGSTDAGTHGMRARLLRMIAGHRQADLVALGDTFVPRLARTLTPSARRLLDLHAGLGHPRIIVSASPIELVQRFADLLGLEGAVGTQAEVGPDGRYTGRLVGALCYGEAKVAQVQRLAAEQGYDLAQSYAYSDSISDLPFLGCVGNPVAVNPDRALRAHAGEQRWPVVSLVSARRSRSLPVRVGTVSL